MSRYDTVRKVFDKRIERIGTSDLPNVKKKNSDILLIATHGDSCDLISQEYYGTPEFWWFVASVNKLKTNNIEAGTQLRIPLSLEQSILK